MFLTNVTFHGNIFLLGNTIQEGFQWGTKTTINCFLECYKIKKNVLMVCLMKPNRIKVL